MKGTFLLINILSCYQRRDKNKVNYVRGFHKTKTPCNIISFPSDYLYSSTKSLFFDFQVHLLKTTRRISYLILFSYSFSSFISGLQFSLVTNLTDISSLASIVCNGVPVFYETRFPEIVFLVLLNSLEQCHNFKALFPLKKCLFPEQQRQQKTTALKHN